VPSKLCKTSLIQLSMPCIHERILSTVGEVVLEVILNIAFILSKANSEMVVMVYDEDGCNEAGPRTVGLGCFSPMQLLDERSEASTK
jgi:hypothetical protein